MKTTELQFDMTDNLIRVFLLPATVSAEFCFGGGHPTNFILVDWFRPSQEVGEPLDIEGIRQFIRDKMYYHPDRNLLAMCRTGEVFLIDPPAKNIEG
jgi:hypothetical protein